MIKAIAPAKINLTLHVTGQRDDGYHLLDSLVMFADVGDRLVLATGAETSLHITGPFAGGVPEDHRNLVWQAAELAGWAGHIQLEKNLPHGAGIGGGSSDAAAVLRALECTDAAGTLGADVPVCLSPTAQRMRGIGENLQPLHDLPPLWAVLAAPPVHVATPQVFRALASKTNPAMPKQLPRFANTRQFALWLADMRNDLEAPAIQIAPEIQTVLQTLSALPGTFLARMSGSGATCFALFDDASLAALSAKDVARAHPSWWVTDCQLS